MNNHYPEVIEQVYHHTDWLYLKLFENRLFFIDFWSFAHLWTGAVLYILLLVLGFRRKWLWLVVILFLYELSEVLFLLFALHIFRPETFKDQGTDLLMGLLGGLTACRIFHRKTAGKNIWPLLPDGVSLFTSATIAFLWVGHYRYHYNCWLLNTPGINYWAFANWLAGGYLLLKVYVWLKRKTGHYYLAAPLAWGIFFTILLGLEAFGYHVMKVREDSTPGQPALILGLIHGNRNLHLFYLFFPLVMILFYEANVWIVRKALLKVSRSC